MPTNYEYQQVTTIAQANALGKDGWRMVHVVPAISTPQGGFFPLGYVMEREVPFSLEVWKEKTYSSSNAIEESSTDEDTERKWYNV